MSVEDASRSSPIRFGVFVVDLRSGELRNDGARVPLQQQPFRVLALLLQASGDIVTRDEFRRELWPNDTFVDFEHGLNVAIARVREALGEEAEQPRFIETLPKRGYRFIGPIDRAAAHESFGRRIRASVWLAVTLLVVVVGAVGFLQTRHPVLTDRDTILVADFVNETGEKVFDDALRQALTIGLEQSPFVGVVSREAVRDALAQMTRPDDEHVVGAVAREVCQRVNAAVSINGSIARLDRRYVVGLEAASCRSSGMFATVQTEARTREDVLKALGAATSQMRHKLGESRTTLERFNMPLEQVTTSSLDALKAYTVAEDIRLHGSIDPIPFFQRAIDHDPTFAMAHAKLAAVYANLNAHDQSMRHASEAYALRGRTSERERLYIEGRECLSRGDDDCFVDIQELWVRTYPRDWLPYDNMAAVHLRRGENEKAADYARRSVELDPTSGFGPTHLLFALFALNRFDEASQVISRLVARSDQPDWHGFMVQIAFVRDDRAAIAAERQKLLSFGGWWFRALLQRVDAEFAEFHGHIREARRLRTALSAPNVPAYADQYGRMSTIDAVYDAAIGDRSDTRSATSAVPSSIADRTELGMSLIAAALRRDRIGVEVLLRSAEASGSLSTLVAVVRPLLSIEAGDPAAANQIPPPAATDLTYLTSGWMARASPLVYLRAIAYFRARESGRAIAECQRIIENRGLDTGSPLYPLAYLQQARAYALLGESEKARKDYDTFFGFWKDADPDVPILREAKAEYGRLSGR
jgi:eukaryotic-like serine/threonine-protein kinase